MIKEGSDLGTHWSSEEEGVGSCGDLLHLRGEWQRLIVPVNSWNADFEVEKKSLNYEVGSPEMESKALAVDETTWTCR